MRTWQVTARKAGPWGLGTDGDRRGAMLPREGGGICHGVRAPTLAHDPKDRRSR